MHRFSISKLGILHSEKGFINLDAGKVTYPNERNPGKIDWDNTLTRETDAECEGYLQTIINDHSELAQQKCTVSAITIDYGW